MSEGILKNTKLIFVGIALILVLFGCAAPQPDVEQVIPTTQQPIEIVRLSLEDAKAAFDNGTAVFVDVRSQSSYAASHIPGALSIPLIELEPRVNELDPNQWIITYCT